MTRRVLIAGNWKMNASSENGVNLASDLANRLKKKGESPFEMVVFPPFTLIGSVCKIVQGSKMCVGGQDCHSALKGAHTGDISATMLKDIGCSYVIVGHSDRRIDHSESDSLIQKKAESANFSGLITIICIGETESERNAGNTLNVVKKQITKSLPESANSENTVIAYEPVWAIGTGRTPTNEEVQHVHAEIRLELSRKLGREEAEKVRLIYGGSLTPENANGFLSLPDVDGGLIGGASLDADDFWSISQSFYRL